MTVRVAKTMLMTVGVLSRVVLLLHKRIHDGQRDARR
jgi:hypothetical protein